MNPYANEEVMWQRLKDSQREAEDRRRFGGGPSGALLLGEAGIEFGRMLQGLFGGIFSGLARRGWTDVPVDETRDAANDAA